MISKIMEIGNIAILLGVLLLLCSGCPGVVSIDDEDAPLDLPVEPKQIGEACDVEIGKVYKKTISMDEAFGGDTSDCFYYESEDKLYIYAICILDGGEFNKTKERKERNEPSYREIDFQDGAIYVKKVGYVQGTVPAPLSTYRMYFTKDGQMYFAFTRSYSWDEDTEKCVSEEGLKRFAGAYLENAK